MWLVWTAFITSTVLVIGTAWHFWRRARGLAVVDDAKQQTPWQLDAAFMFLGIIGVVSTVPGLFFGEPNWAIDRVYWLISKVGQSAA